MPRTFAITPGKISSACWISAAVLKREKEKRRLLRARLWENPIARRTWEGWREPAMHAEPADAQIFARSNSRSALSASTPSKERLEVFGSRWVRSPLI